MISTYSPTGDILTIVLCLVCFIFLFATYTEKQKRFSIFCKINITIFAVAIESLIFHYLKGAYDVISGDIGLLLVLMEAVIYISILIILIWFIIYLTYLFNYTDVTREIIQGLSIFPLIFYTIIKILEPFVNCATYGHWIFIDAPRWGFFAFYFYYYFIIGILLLTSGKRIVTKMGLCLKFTFLLSFFLTIGQFLIYSKTFLIVSFIIPTLVIMLLFHYRPYDIVTGGLDRTSLAKYLQYEGKNKYLGIYALQLKNFIFDNNSISLMLLKNASGIFKNYQVFRLSNDTLFLVFDKGTNLNTNILENVLCLRLESLRKKSNISFKLIYMDYDEEVLNSYKYTSLYEVIRNKVEWDSFYFCEYEDYRNMNKTLFLHDFFKQIENCDSTYQHPDIHIYYQPIWDEGEKVFNSIEILSRISYGEELIYPEEFIPFALKNGYLCYYNRFVFDKACSEFADILKNDDSNIKVMSMNFSVQEILKPHFTRSIVETLRKYEIPKHKIAIEIIESSNTTKIEEIKDVILKLKQYGIKVYLDDFGTEYSNFDRILYWPVDVIKVDKHLTWSMRNNDTVQPIIKGVISSLNKAGYKILFEGVETEEDLEKCKQMNATYLQGFHYSKPINYNNLLQFLNIA